MSQRSGAQRARLALKGYTGGGRRDEIAWWLSNTILRLLATKAYRNAIQTLISVGIDEAMTVRSSVGAFEPRTVSTHRCVVCGEATGPCLDEDAIELHGMVYDAETNTWTHDRCEEMP